MMTGNVHLAVVASELIIDGTCRSGSADFGTCDPRKSALLPSACRANQGAEFSGPPLPAWLLHPLISRRYAEHGIAQNAGVARQRWDAVVEGHLRAWIAGNPAGRHGVHRYAADDFGLRRGQIARRFAAYRARQGFTAAAVP